jgi:outer membrane protein
MRMLSASCGAAALLVLAGAMPAHAQDDDEGPRRTRIGAGVQVVPKYPGADGLSIRPLLDLSRTRGDRPFEFEAPDESAGFPLIRAKGFAFGPAVGFEGQRRGRDVGTDLPKVGFTVEPGAFVQYSFADSFRLRAEVRHGVGGHKGLISNVSADYVARNGDDWLFSIGPRMTITNDRYNRAYFSVLPEDAADAGLPAYRAKGGVQALGAAAGFSTQFSRQWGIFAYGKYDRLVGDAADSPIVREYGSRDQFSAGAALTYTFGGE